MKKKVKIIALAVILVIGSIGAIVLGVRAYQKSKLVADVMAVVNLNIGYYEDGMQSEGQVTNDDSQALYLDSSQDVREIYVSEGETVHVGDALMAYDVTSLAHSIEIKKMEIENLRNQYAVANEELKELRQTKPSENITTPVVPSEPEPTEDPLPADEKTGDAYNYISEDAIAYNLKEAQENPEAPFRYLCTKDAFVFGSFLNKVVKEGLTVVFEIREGNAQDGEIISSWTVCGNKLQDEFEADGRFYILTSGLVIDKPVEPEPEPEPEQPGQTYTALELAKAITQKEQELKQLDLQRRKEELNLSVLENDTANGVVYSKINGIVKKVGDPNNPPTDGTPFLQVSGSDGLYVKGAVSELQLDNITVGQEITATSWENGQMYVGKIASIDRYPTDNLYYYGSSNPNSSYYGYTAYIENPDGLYNGQYLQMTIGNKMDNSSGNTIYLQQCYVKEEDGQSYVLKDENGKLKKQYVVTGKILWGSYVEIKSGLAMEDYIAFPYGKSAQEGVKTSKAE